MWVIVPTSSATLRFKQADDQPVASKRWDVALDKVLDVAAQLGQARFQVRGD
jgi:hypothetical protein